MNSEKKSMNGNTHIVTGQFVRISQAAASLGERMAAQLIDWAIELVWIFAIIWLLTQIEEVINSSIFPIIAYVLLLFIPIICYSLLWELFNHGQTPGKRLIKLRVVMLITRNHQRFGDMAAGTMVIKLARYNKISVTLDEFDHLSPDYKPFYPQAADLSLEQVNLISQTLKANPDDPHITALADKVCKVLAITHVRESNSHEFLERILRDYQYYALQEVI